MDKLRTIPHQIGSAPSLVGTPPKIAGSFYTSPDWRALTKAMKQEHLRDDIYTCATCGTGHGRMIWDHIQEIKDGGAKLDRSNIQLLCIGCHSRKTARAKKQRAHGKL